MTETSQPQDDQEVKTEQAAIALPGHRLKARRDELKLSREEVAHHLHLDAQIVVALETDDYEKLPSPAYICGYLRSYARLLKLPEAEIVNAYSKGQQINAALIPENISFIPERKSSPIILKSIWLMAIVVLIVAGAMWLVNNLDVFSAAVKPVSRTIDVPVEVHPEVKADATAEAAASQIHRPLDIQQKIQEFNEQAVQNDQDQVTESGKLDDTESPPLLIDENGATPLVEADAQNTQATEEGDLRLVFSADSWTEVTDADGQRRVYRLVREGDDFTVKGTAPFVVLLGNADAVKVYYKGQEFNHQRYQRGDIAYFRIGLQQD